MPCGPLQAMQVYALSTGSFIGGALSMFLFSLGTVPLMLFVGIVVNIFKGKRKILINKIASILILILSIVMLNRGLLSLNIDLFRGFKNYGDFDAKSIGHAMFVAPGQEKYPLHVVLDNNLEGFSDSNMDLNIALSEGTLKIGHSYEITIVVYGLSDIKVYATLTNWLTGEVIAPLNLDEEDAD